MIAKETLEDRAKAAGKALKPGVKLSIIMSNLLRTGF